MNGGAHADNNVDFQEFMIIACRCADVSEALRWGGSLSYAERRAEKRGYQTAVSDEGGFAGLKSNEEAIEVILEAITGAGYVPGEQIAIALDPASSEFHKDNQYVFRNPISACFIPEQMVAYWVNWCSSIRSFPLKTVWPKTTGRAGRQSRQSSATPCNWSATIVRHKRQISGTRY
ncbi:MAG: hypothetical protein U0Y68_17410 [Blastocatellia bacterium]